MADLMRRIEALALNFQRRMQEAPDAQSRDHFQATLKTLRLLAETLAQNKPVFGIEPWHPLQDDVPLAQPGEMLLRLQTASGKYLPSYPFIMSFYDLRMSADIDTILMLAALRQFESGEEKQVSINVSAQSFYNRDFIKTILSHIEKMRFAPAHKIILEIHESTPSLVNNLKAINLFRKFGIAFAIDDVGLHMNDVLRLSGFADIADYIKIERESVVATADKPHALAHVMEMVTTFLPRAVVVAEGVRSPQHARTIQQHHPRIAYVQGMKLPGRGEFKEAWGVSAHLKGR